MTDLVFSKTQPILKRVPVLLDKHVKKLVAGELGTRTSVLDLSNYWNEVIEPAKRLTDSELQDN